MKTNNQNGIHFAHRNTGEPITPRRVARDKFKRHNPATGKRDKLTPRTATVWIETPAHNSWIKAYDCLYETYFEQKPRVLHRDQIFIYNHLRSLANRGFEFNFTDYARDVLGITKNDLAFHFDRLQDALLLHRVCRPDLRGCPHDLVLHIPLTLDQWHDEKKGKLVCDRVNLQKTRLDREDRCALVTDKNGKSRRVRTVSNCCPPEFQFRESLVTDVFENYDEANAFTDLVLDILFDSQNLIVNGDRRTYEIYFRSEVTKYAVKKQLHLNDARMRAALELKRRYAPTEF